jgi:hypothetical protein
MPKYRHIGTSAVEVFQGEKCVMLAPGDFITLSAEDEKNELNQALNLLPVDDKKGGK